jgi:threonine dehydratase
MNHTITINEIKNAQDNIANFIKKTPLIKIEANVYLKGEHHQVTKSFKPRGACNAMLNLSEEARKKGIITRSSGNFAQAISYIGKQLDTDVTVVMPEHVPKAKIDATKSWGATVILKGTQHAEAQALVDQLADEKGLTKMHPYDDPDVIAGQGTAMLEICEALDKVDIFFCPISGGGLMSGCATALKALHPTARIIAVEPEHANDYALYRTTSKFTVLTEAHSVADGLLAPVVGKHCKPLLDAYVDDVIVVTDDEILNAMKKIKQLSNEEVEPSGAAAYAAFEQFKKNNDIENKTVVCMASGGNFDKERFPL